MTEPIGDDPADVELLAAALRADAGDLDSYAAVLTTTIADALPVGMVEVERDRSVGDRLAGRPGRAVAVRVHTGVDTLELLTGRRGELTARVAQQVRGVVISRREVPVGEWVRLLAANLAERARHNADARAALARLLGAGG